VARIIRLGEAFRAIVFAQVRIAALNTLFAAFYLGVASDSRHPSTAGEDHGGPDFHNRAAAGHRNLISNTVVVVVSLSHSPATAVASLGFLLVLHKLEYFLNARIVGTQIHARAWEILLSMLLMEAAFGIPGVVAAPIYYAYIKGNCLNTAWSERGLFKRPIRFNRLTNGREFPGDVTEAVEKSVHAIQVIMEELKSSVTKAIRK